MAAVSKTIIIIYIDTGRCGPSSHAVTDTKVGSSSSCTTLSVRLSVCLSVSLSVSLSLSSLPQACTTLRLQVQPPRVDGMRRADVHLTVSCTSGSADRHSVRNSFCALYIYISGSLTHFFLCTVHLHQRVTHTLLSVHCTSTSAGHSHTSFCALYIYISGSLTHFFLCTVHLHQRVTLTLLSVHCTSTSAGHSH